MKIISLLFCLAIGIEAAPAVVALPLVTGTNDLAAIYMANNVRIASQNYYFLSGKVDRLERQIERLEIGVFALSILLGSAVAAVCLLTTRDRNRERRIGRDMGVTRIAENMQSNLKS